MTEQAARPSAHPTDLTAFVAEWRAWHAAKDARLADPHGFLAVTAIHWLDEEPTRHDDAPGAWSTGPEGVVVDLADGEVLTTQDGAAVSGRHVVGSIPERGSVLLSSGDAVIEVARRGGHDIVRPRHPDNPRRLAFAGTPSYEPDPAWVVPARWTGYPEEQPTTVGSVVDGLEHVYGAIGELHLDLGGSTHRLVAFPGTDPGSLHVLFSDTTAGITTYGAVRSLSVPPPGPDGEVVLDLNRATNLPCAYTPHATCPLPPAGNTLPVAVEAGEKIPVPFDGATDEVRITSVVSTSMTG